MSNVYVKWIEYRKVNQKLRRLLIITLSNKTKVFAALAVDDPSAFAALYRQEERDVISWGADTDEERAITAPIIRAHEVWIKSGRLPFK